MRVSEADYLRLALDEPDEKWELHCGHPRKKPAMTWDHNLTARTLRRALERQLDPLLYDVVVDQGRLRRSGEGYYIPDLYVVPVALRRRLYRSGELELYPGPLPLVVEVWSPSTGGYDIESKLPEYQQRGDQETWRIHPIERTSTVWRRRPDGSYTESVIRDGVVRPSALPRVVIELSALFDW